jgi:hypothetical protein
MIKLSVTLTKKAISSINREPYRQRKREQERDKKKRIRDILSLSFTFEGCLGQEF